MLRVTFPRLDMPKALIQLLREIIGTAPHTAYYAGDPNGNVAGNIGDLCINPGGGASTTLWVKESGNGTNTGWVGK